MAQKRKRIKHKATFEERLAKEAIKFKEAAEKQPPGSTARELSLRRARQAKTAVHLSDCCIRRSKDRYGGRAATTPTFLAMTII